jgi:hypothetical protein
LNDELKIKIYKFIINTEVFTQKFNNNRKNKCINYDILLNLQFFLKYPNIILKFC